MLSIRLVVAGLLALSGVEAKHKDKVGVIEFSKGDCNGRPSSGLREFKRNKCYILDKPHVRFGPPGKPKHDEWHNKDCHVKVFEGYGCQWNKYQKEISVPTDFGKCTSLDSQVSSALFVCQWADRKGARNHTMELPAASHSVKFDRRADDPEHTLTVTANRPSDSDSDSDDNVVAPAKPTGDAKLSARKDYNEKGVWMLHPWAKSPICYLCWTDHASITSELKCRSGPKYAWIDCGPQPESVPHTSSHTVTKTSTSTVHLLMTTVHAGTRTTTETVTEKSTETATPTAPLAERLSRHTPVVFKHPYIDDKLVCADAEWENEGKRKAEVRLQHVKRYAKCPYSAVRLNFAEPLHTKSYTATVTEKVFTTGTASP